MNIVAVQSLSRVPLFANPWTTACLASLSFTVSQNLLKLMSIELVMPFNHLILHYPLLLLPSIFPSIRVFSNESALHQSIEASASASVFSFSGLISFRIDWFGFLAVQGALKSFLQHHSSKESILQCSAFFTAELSHPYVTTGKPIALIIRIFVSKVMFLLFNMLSRLVIAFLPWTSLLLSKSSLIYDYCYDHYQISYHFI